MDPSPASSAVRGLSPRVRGNPPQKRGGTRCFGSIPARAGEPERFGRLSRQGGVYPRACGGTTFASMKASAEKGLSPRVRGNLPMELVLMVGTGSIPARAGEP